MKKRILLAVIALIVVSLVSLALILVPPSLELTRARSELDRPAEELTRERLEDVRERLARAVGQLDGRPTGALKLAPVIGANVDTLDAVADRALASLDAALRLRDALDEADEAGLFGEGRVDLETIADLEEPLQQQTTILDTLEQTAAEELNGSLVPPLWDAVEGLRWRAQEVATSGRRALEAFGVLPQMLGAEEDRRYLILLLNNAELRGAGGILAGLGTLRVNDGRLEIGEFSSIHQLRPARFTRVPAPAEYERRFGIYDANTTLWLNSTYSPDVPDVALVASRLYEAVTGVATDGAIVADPRGLESLLPPDDEIDVPGSDVEIDARELARFVYSDAYEEFDRQRERRDAILSLGQAAMERIVETGFGSAETREAVGTAIAGGHLRFTSFLPEEQAVLNALGVTGELGEPVHDDVMVTIQNRGGGESQGSKLDYWTERHIGHTCDVRSDLSATCATEITLTNTVPQGLVTYVAGRPYGLLRGYLEVFLPRDATITSVSRDGGDLEFQPDEQSGYHALGAYLELEPDQVTQVRVDYELPAGETPFEFRMRPQPLARDAGVSLDIHLPSDGIWHGIGDVQGGTVRWRGTLDRAITGTLTADTRSGLPALWDALGDFFREPLF